MGYYNSFVVRIWREESSNAMRGEIQHVASQERIAFLDWQRMLDFIVTHLTQQDGRDRPPGEESHGLSTPPRSSQ